MEEADCDSEREGKVSKPGTFSMSPAILLRPPVVEGPEALADSGSDENSLKATGGSEFRNIYQCFLKRPQTSFSEIQSTREIGNRENEERSEKYCLGENGNLFSRARAFNTSATLRSQPSKSSGSTSAKSSTGARKMKSNSHLWLVSIEEPEVVTHGGKRGTDLLFFFQIHSIKLTALFVETHVFAS